MEMNSGALHRFLAEAVWYPTALFPGRNLQWAELDESRAVATLTNGGNSVALEFRFNERNEVAGIYSPGRWGSFDGGYKQLAWEGSFAKYVQHNGVLVPSVGEVGWYVDGGWRPVWRGTVTDAVLQIDDSISPSGGARREPPPRN